MKIKFVLLFCGFLFFPSCQRAELCNLADLTTTCGLVHYLFESQLKKGTPINGTNSAIGPLKTYVTTNSYTILSFGSVTGADTLCMSDPGKPADSSNYKALLVDESGCSSIPCRRASLTANLGDGQIDWVFKPNRNYVRADGVTPIMTTNENAIFIFGTLTNSWISIARTGVSSMSSNWTTFTNSNCTNYSSNSGSVTTSVYNLNSGASISNAGLSCASSYYLLCIEQ